jgi:hypothetical protein
MLRHHPALTTPITRDLPVGFMVDSEERALLPGTLRYDPADPIGITLTIRSGDSRSVAWTFARQLLSDGLREAAGAGDVRVAPTLHDGHRRVAVVLSSPTGHAELDLPRDRVETFLHQTYAAVPTTMEADLIDWEAEFDPLLGPSQREAAGGTGEPDPGT